MPPLAAIFLGQLLNVARFNPFPGLIFMERDYGYLLEGAHNSKFATYGYRSLYMTANLNWIVIFGAVTVIIWFLAWLKDACVGQFHMPCGIKRRCCLEP